MPQRKKWSIGGQPFRSILVRKIAEVREALRLPTVARGYAELRSKTIEVAISGASPLDTASWLPEKSQILGCAARVTQAITGATAINVGDGSTANRFLASITTYTLGFTARLALTAANMVQDAAGTLRVAWTGTGTGGRLRITIWYFQITQAPQSQ